MKIITLALPNIDTAVIKLNAFRYVPKFIPKLCSRTNSMYIALTNHHKFF